MKICSVCKRCFDDSADHCVDTGHPPLSVSHIGDPLMVPGYSLEHLVASAAKIDTYRANRLDCDRSCLVRIVSADAQNREDFLRDARLAAMVFDARVADIYEAGSLSGGEFFVVEEDVEGQTTLRQYLAEAGVPELLTSIRIVEQIAETLHVFHINGLTHGAVRSENIIIDYAPDGLPIVKLCGIDLGAVIARNTIANKFLIDSAIDAIRYYSPEQCSGQPLSPQTDIYSLGVVFYELLAGVPPFDAPKATAVVEMHRSHRPPEITIEDFELRMLVTHSLSESLQKQPSFRQSSADLFARQMRHIEQLATHVSTPPPAVGAPAAPPRITPTPIASNSTHSPVEPEFVEDYPSSVEEFAEPIQEAEPEPVSEPVGTEVHAYAAYEESHPEHELEPQPEPEPPPINFKEADENMPAASPEGAIEIPLPERTSLAERRHRLKIWMKQTHPSRPVRPETTADAMPAAAPQVDNGLPPNPELVVDTTVPVEEIQLETANKSKLIEWEQPDDIPTIEEIESESVIDLEPPAGVQAVSDTPTAQEEPETAPATVQPHLIEWEQPEDDIPSIDELIEARASDEPPVIRAIQFRPEDFQVAAAVKERIQAEMKTPDPIPIAIAANEVRVSEISSFEFVPALLDGAKELSNPASQPDYTSIFASFDPVEPPPRVLPYRSMFIGLGLMVVAVILGLGGEPLWRYFNEPEPSKPVATKAASVPAAPMPAHSDRSTGEELPAPEIEPPNSFSNTVPADETPERTTPKRTTTTAAVPKAKRAIQTSSPVPVVPERSATTSFSPSTVVITYGGGNVRRSDAPQHPSNSASRSLGPKSSGTTRPRIVQAPPNR